MTGDGEGSRVLKIGRAVLSVRCSDALHAEIGRNAFRLRSKACRLAAELPESACGKVLKLELRKLITSRGVNGQP